MDQIKNKSEAEADYELLMKLMKEMDLLSPNKCKRASFKLLQQNYNKLVNLLFLGLTSDITFRRLATDLIERKRPC